MNNQDIQNKLSTIRVDLNESPFLRTLRKPLKMVAPLIMRKLSYKKEVSVNLVSGGKFHGILPEAVSTVIWRHGYFEYDTSKNILSNLPKDGIFIDIGAHFGYFSSLAANVLSDKGKVISIEAMPSTFKYLQKNLKENSRGAEIHTINKAAFNKETTLNFSDYGVVFSSLNSAFGIRNDSVDQSHVTDIKVPTLLVDNLVQELSLERVDVVKIDAESSEYYVLEGMIKTLEAFSPVVIIELGDDGIEGAQKSSKDIVDLLKPLGYQTFEFQNDKLVSVEERDKYHYCNLIFKKTI